jgi:hypothetical protein
MDARLGKAQTGGTLAGPFDRTVDVLKGVLGENAVVTEALDLEQSAVCAEADVAQFPQIVQSFANAELVSVVNGGLGAQGALLFVILLDPGALVINVDGGCDAPGEDAGAQAARGAAGDAAVKDQLDLVGPAEIEVLADDLFEKQPAVNRAIEDLGQRKLGLQDRDIVAVAARRSPAVNGWGRNCSHLRNKRSIFSADKPSQICCSRWGSAQLSTPLSSA